MSGGQRTKPAHSRLMIIVRAQNCLFGFLIPSYQRAPYVLVFSQNNLQIYLGKNCMTYLSFNYKNDYFFFYSLFLITKYIYSLFLKNKVSTLRCPRAARYGWEHGTDLGSAGPLAVLVYRTPRWYDLFDRLFELCENMPLLCADVP